MKIRKLFGLVLLTLFLPQFAWGQSSITLNNPAEHFNIAPGGVDLRTGRYVYEATDLSIGAAGQSSGLALKRTMPEAIRSHNNTFGNFSSNWDLMLTVYPWDVDGISGENDFRATVHSQGLARTFDSAGLGPGFSAKSEGPAEYLTYTGGTRLGASTVYTYTGGDGTVIVFRPLGGKDCSSETIWTCAYASSMTEPDGTVYTFSYASTGETGGNYVRLSKVVSSRGYALVFEGSSGIGGLGSRISKACVINLALSTLPTTCPSSALAAVTYTYDGNNRLTGVTGPDGATDSFGYVAGTGSYQMQFTKAGQSSPWLTNTITTTTTQNEEGTPIETVTFQSFADGHTYAYAYTQNPAATSIAGGGYVDNLGNGTSVPYGFPIMPGSGPEDQTVCTSFPCELPEPDQFTWIYQQTPGPISITDALGHTTTFEYCDAAAMAGLPYYYVNRCVVDPLISFTDPEGAKTELTYSGRNVSQVRRKAKPGSGLADIVTSATYDCSNPKICAKPLTVTDANGKVTTYTYKAETGDVLTETKPADANGIQAVTRNEYVQRYAWVSNGSGGYVQSAAPVWLLSATKTCRTTATVSGACAGGTADEVVTSYDYGPDSGPNLLLLRGTVVTADGISLRTCYAYDAMGNQISETSPRAGLTVCP
jgi:hypothetical protein